MRPSRFLFVVAIVALFTASVAPAGAATPGVGSSTGSLSVLDLDVGNLLALDLLHDKGDANTDPDVGEPSASAALNALTVAAPLLGVEQTVPVVETSSTGEKQTASSAVTPISNDVLSGSLLPVDLSAVVGDDGAASSIGAGLADLSILSGILDVQSTELLLGSNAKTAQADGARALSIDGLTALDLEALLAGLGISLDQLPLDVALDLIDSLGLLPTLGAAIDELGLPVDLDNLTPEQIVGLVVGLAGVDELEGALSADTPLCDPVDPVVEVIGGVIGSTNVGDELCSELIDNVGDLDVEGILGQLDGVLDEIVALLDAATLVVVDGLEVGIVTTATDSVDTSVADVQAALGSITVGGLALPAIDLQATLDQINTVVETANTTLDDVLSTIDDDLAGLADLVDIALFEETTSVTEEGGVVTSQAEFNALRVDVGVPDLSAITDLLEGFAAQETLGDLLAGLPSPVELPAHPLTTISETLTGDGDLVTVLGDGLSARVGSLAQQSSFEVLSSTATPQAPEQPNLPNTGSNDTVMILFAAVAAAGALGLRRVARAGV